MKKIISTLLVFVLLLGCVLTLASCGKTLSGTYEREDLGVKTSYTFKGKDVTFESKATVLGSVVTTTKTGTYEIEETDDGLEITFTWVEEGKDDVVETLTLEEGKKNDVKYVKIGLVEYTKAD